LVLKSYHFCCVHYFSTWYQKDRRRGKGGEGLGEERREEGIGEEKREGKLKRKERRAAA
jgi:hypothetical protein